MGSCYSCRSNGGPPTYSTVAMANPDAKDKRKVPYTRAGSTSFGFKKRIPATMKSHSQERTGQLVSQYENKLASLGNSNSGTGTYVAVASGRKLSSPVFANASPTLNTNPTRRTSGAKHASSNSSVALSDGTHRGSVCNGDSVETISCSDDNCNDILLSSNRAPMKPIPCNKVNSLLSSPKRAADRRQGLVGEALNEDARNGNDKRQSPAGSRESLVSRASASRLPQKFRTTVSGLPRPQVPVYVSKTNVARSLKASGDWRVEAQTMVTVEPMQISADGVPSDEAATFDADSGIGNSVSDRRNDGDTETLAEVDQIEGDSLSLSSVTKEHSPEKAIVATVSIPKQAKKEENLQKKSAEANPKATKQSGIARLRSALPSKMAQPKPRQGSPVLAEKVNKVAAPSQSLLQQPKHWTKKQPAENTKLAVPKMSPKRSAEPKASKELKKADRFRKDLGGSTEEWKLIAELRQKENITPDMEEVEIKPIALSLQKQSPALTEPKTGRKSPKIETTLPPSVFERQEAPVTRPDSAKKAVNYFESDAKEHYHHDMGPYSPPSEKDFFLIDDEIADQPALIACQSLDASSYHQMRLQANLTDMNEEGGFPALAHAPLRVEIPKRGTAFSVDTLSPCSSLGSDDLMLDFERTDDGLHDSRHNRTSSDIFQDGGQGDVDSSGRFYPSTKHNGPSKSPVVGGIFVEWSQMNGSFQADGSAPGSCSNSAVKYRPAKQDSNSSSNVVTKNAMGSAELNAVSHSTPSRPTTASSGSSYVARRSIAPNLRPPKQMSVAETDDGGAKIDASSYLAMSQDVTNVKTMLLRLKRVLQENNASSMASTLNPFEGPTWKNDLFINLANNDPPDGVAGDRVTECDGGNTAVAEIEQENADLRRQVVFFQQQIEERDRTIKLLQQQMAKYSSSIANPERKEMSNAACQTERQKSLMGSSLSSSSEESAFGSTVSFRIGKF